MAFKELDKRNVSEVEKSILESWGGINKITERQIENRKDSDNFVFYDGPATANGMPGVHHILAKLLKDTFCKYKTMKGFRVLRKVGWDTHGLPVELQVEKTLGFKSKNDIEEYGIKEFNEKCRESVWENETAFRKLTEDMGQFIDLEHPYVTYDNNYIETEWWILKKFFDAGLIYEGYKILPYCPRCGTGLASHEVAQGYKDIAVNTVTVPFKLKNEENTYFLVWTTTPWTLLSNVAVCVNPEETYIKANSKGYNFIVADKLAKKVLGEEFEVVETYKGKDLEYTEYEQLLPYINVNKKAFFVVCDTYVTMEDGTGLVHIAPAFGQDDYEVGRKYDLPVLNPVGEDGKYTEGPWAGTFVMDPELEITIIKLKSIPNSISISIHGFFIFDKQNKPNNVIVSPINNGAHIFLNNNTFSKDSTNRYMNLFLGNLMDVESTGYNFILDGYDYDQIRLYAGGLRNTVNGDITTTIKNSKFLYLVWNIFSRLYSSNLIHYLFCI